MARNAISSTNFNLANNYNLNNIGATITGDNAPATLRETNDDNNDANRYNETNNIDTSQNSISKVSTNASAKKLPPKQNPTPTQAKPLEQPLVAKVSVTKPPAILKVKKPTKHTGYYGTSSIGTYSLSHTADSST